MRQLNIDAKNAYLKYSSSKFTEKLIDEKFLRIACLFSHKMNSMKKNTYIEHMRHSNIYAENAYLKYSSSKKEFLRLNEKRYLF